MINYRLNTTTTMRVSSDAILLKTGACNYDLKIWNGEETIVITNADPETIAQTLLKNDLLPIQVTGINKEIEREYQQLKEKQEWF